MLEKNNDAASLVGVCFSEMTSEFPNSFKHMDCILAQDICDYRRNFQDAVGSSRSSNQDIFLPKFDASKRNGYLRRRLGLSLKTDSLNEKIFVFKSDNIEGVQTSVRMGDSVLAVDGVRCKSLDEMVSLIGYGEDRQINLLVERDSKLIDGHIIFN